MQQIMYVCICVYIHIRIIISSSLMTVSDLKAPLESMNATFSVLRGRELLPREEVCIFTLIVKKMKSDVLSSAHCLPSQVFNKRQEAWHWSLCHGTFPDPALLSLNLSFFIFEVETSGLD